jgi:hypothetical protein
MGNPFMGNPPTAMRLFLIRGTGLALMGKPCLFIFFHRQGVPPDESL